MRPIDELYSDQQLKSFSTTECDEHYQNHENGLSNGSYACSPSKDTRSDTDIAKNLCCLKELFPLLDNDFLWDVLVKYDNDMEKCTDHLLCEVDGPLTTGDDDGYENDNGHGSGDDDHRDNAFGAAKGVEPAYYHVSYLREIFPHMEIETIEKSLLENDDDLERATEALLNHDVVSSLEQQLKIEAQEEKLIHKENLKSWGDIDYDIDQIMELTDINYNKAKMYLHKNGKDIVRALVHIITDHVKMKEKKVKSKSVEVVHEVDVNNLNPHRPRGGRVQRGPQRTNTVTQVKVVPKYSLSLKEKQELKKSKPYGLESQYSSSSSKSSFSKTSSSSSSGLSSIDESRETQEGSNDEYIFSETNPAFLELGELISGDKALVDISWEFYKNALIFFKGDVSRVLCCAIFISEKEGSSSTYMNTNRTLDFSQLFKEEASKKPAYKEESFKEVSLKKHSITGSSSSSFTAHNIEQDLHQQQIKLQRAQLRRARENSILDLHRFHVKTAKATVPRALEEWWNDELRARENSGRAHPGERAREIDELVIVTGRGIHSDAGISKLKASIKAFLDRSSYIYREETSRFIVTGKKRQ